MAKQENQKIIEQWERLKTLLSATEDDVVKNAKGNASAGVRARKGLRLLKAEAHSLIKLTVQETKEKK